jgi:hypothetical protein
LKEVAEFVEQFDELGRAMQRIRRMRGGFPP